MTVRFTASLMATIKSPAAEVSSCGDNAVRYGANDALTIIAALEVLPSLGAQEAFYVTVQLLMFASACASSSQ